MIRDLKSINTMIAKEVADRRHFGAQMSNVFFNLSQHAERPLEAHER